MKLKMNQNSLFAILLRTPWWVSGGIAAALFASARLVLPAEYGPYAFFVALPFAVIAVHVAWKVFRAPSEAGIAETLASLRGMSWTDFSAVVEEAFRADGYGVAPIQAAGADFEVTRGGRVSVVGCKRWKAARTGIEPLRELDAVRLARDAHEAIYIAAGGVSDNARAFAREKALRLLEDAELVRMFAGKFPKS